MASPNGLILKSSRFDISHLPQRKVFHLRNHEYVNNFKWNRFTFSVNLPASINLTTHQNMLEDNVQVARTSMFGLMKEALSFSACNSIMDEAVVHVYLHCTCLDMEFVFNAGGK